MSLPTSPPPPNGLRAGGGLGDTARRVVAEAPEHPGADLTETLAWVGRVGADVASTPRLLDVWDALAVAAQLDVAAARALEPHVDALRIFAEASTTGRTPDLEALGDTRDATWGVFAAEGGGRVHARDEGDTWMLEGTKPWCSLARRLSHALVTGWIDDSRRGLFAVSLTGPGVVAHEGPWHSRGLPEIVSAPVDFQRARAVLVGEPDWYLTRPGFARGGIGVAACWWGGAVALREPLRASAARADADQLARTYLGRVDAALWGARAALAEAAELLDRSAPGADLDESEPTSTRAEKTLAARVRALVARAAELALDETDHALGPLPLVADERHARRTADLRIYLRQHHGDRDVARLGRDLSAGVGAW